MRLAIRHEIRRRYEPPAGSVTQVLRLTPRGHDGQYVAGWRIDLDRNARLHAAEDAFGNLTHIFSVEGGVDALTVTAEGEVETHDTSGLVKGAVERFPIGLYLRETPLTCADSAIAGFAKELAHENRRGGALDTLNGLLSALHRGLVCEAGGREQAATAAAAFALRRGTAEELAQIFIAAARSLGYPARCVGGYLRPPASEPQRQRMGDGSMSQAMDRSARRSGAAHAWAEAHVTGLGWIGFDPARGTPGGEDHVRVAVGLDRLGAAPVRGARLGGDGETVTTEVSVEPA